MVKALLFDLDGTLLDSVDDLTVAINNTLSARSLPEISRADVALFIGKGAKVLVERALRKSMQREPEANFVDEVLPEYLKQMQLAEGTRTKVLSYVPDALKQLYEAGYKMAVVTNKPAAIARKLLSQYKLLEFFQTAIGAGDVSSVKPNPEMLLLAAKRMGVDIHECAMIGDSLNDSFAGKNAGIQVFLLKTGYNEGVVVDEWARVNAPDDIVFDTMKELSEFLLENERRK